jgi:predicted flap endonuclease-1-like 5' DNA nuclease
LDAVDWERFSAAGKGPKVNHHDVSKKSAWDVRQSAQAHLRALRAERMRKRDTRKQTSDGQQDAPYPGGTTDAEFEIRIPSSHDPVHDPEETEIAEVVALDPMMPQTEINEPNEPEEEVAILAETDVPEADVLPELVLPLESEPQDIERPPAEEKADTDTVVLQESDLMVLPGIGPGLVWMLNRSGIHSLTELGAANPVALRSSLGLVGDLLDLDYWIGIAREHQKI